ncbi:rod-binding protein [Paracoccus sp. p4-l81]|uniref:rod-binding protein n=1 Tax=unclassified Paracoccus (in: a-proteobacteria) TaxID=2688777 RepID=UPI0035B7BFAF
MTQLNAVLRPPTAAPTDANALRKVATQLEAGFLAEMLKASGVGKASDSFGGGAGEDQFASFLRDAQADAMAARGGIGLAESIFRTMARRAGEGHP